MGDLFPGPLIAAWLNVPAGTFRRWVAEGLIAHKATGRRGAKLYDVHEAGKVAAERGRLTAAK